MKLNPSILVHHLKNAGFSDEVCEEICEAVRQKNELDDYKEELKCSNMW